MSKDKNIVLITGSFPPNICGVGDYTKSLLDELVKSSSEFNFLMFYRERWEFKYVFKYYRELRELRSRVVHLQYPTEGFKYSIVPLLLFVLNLCSAKIVTLHELSSRNLLAYIYSQILVLFADYVIVTNSLEAAHAKRFLLINKGKVRVVPIGSNISASPGASRIMEERDIDLAYFGHIRPLKGLEEFLALVKADNSIKKRRVAIIGQKLDSYSSFFGEICDQAVQLNIHLFVNYDESQTSDLLSKTKLVYLPFPDGVSLRRGSLLAALMNGCNIVSTHSPFEEFNRQLGQYFFLAENRQEAVGMIEGLLSGNVSPKPISEIFRKSFAWERIAAKHLGIYREA